MVNLSSQGARPLESMEYADGLVAGTVQNITPPNGFYHYRKIDFFCRLKQFSSVFWKPTKLTEESYPIKIKLSSISSTRPMGRWKIGHLLDALNQRKKLFHQFWLDSCFPVTTGEHDKNDKGSIYKRAIDSAHVTKEHIMSLSAFLLLAIDR
jgi:hypothetical protein